MKTSKVFKLAKAELCTDKMEWDKERYICRAIAEVDAPFDDKARAKRIIENLLKNCFSLEEWLCVNHNIPLLTTNNTNPHKMQVTRHKWLNHLIKHYESLGD